MKLHSLAEGLQLGTVDAMKPHAELKNRYCKDLSCLQIGAFKQRGPIFVEGSDNGTQMRLGVRDQAQPIVRVTHLHCPLTKPRSSIVATKDDYT